jgi:hypothetical protein
MGMISDKLAANARVSDIYTANSRCTHRFQPERRRCVSLTLGLAGKRARMSVGRLQVHSLSVSEPSVLSGDRTRVRLQRKASSRV